MRIVSISRTDKADITLGIINEARSRGDIVLKASYTKTIDDPMFYSLFPGKFLHSANRFIVNITGKDGFFSKRATKKFVKKLSDFHPDLVLMHYPHGYYLNLPILLNYCTNNRIPVVFIANDTWAITGRCSYFELNGCDKWKTGCGNCPFPREFPKQILCDFTHSMWLKKKDLLTKNNVYVVSPSKWLTNYLLESYLPSKHVFTIYNGTDISKFYVRTHDEVLACKKRFGIDPNKKMILACARPWSKRKGLSYINELAKSLSNDFQVVVVGLSEKDITDPTIIRISEYLTRDEMSILFSSADVFVNPTQDEVWGLVNVESLACGTPVVAFDSGGVPECLDALSGTIVKKGDFSAFRDATLATLSKSKPIDACLARASQFSLDHMSKEYVDFFEKIVGDSK